MLFDHVSSDVSETFASKAFFTAALSPPGIKVTGEGEGWAVVGGSAEGNLGFGSYAGSPGPVHIDFNAKSRQEDREFYAAAPAAGAKDTGAPGLRLHCHPNYYGALVVGLRGHDVEAVCHVPEA